MEYIPIERSGNAFQQPIEQSHLIAMCQRAFGRDIQIESAKELNGGFYNNTYLIHIVRMHPVILRVSPHLARQFRLEKNLLRSQAPRHRMPGLVRRSTWPVETPRGKLRD